MKKIISLLVITFLSISLIFAQKRELSDYENYRMEQEAKEYPQEAEIFYIVEDMPTFNGENAKEFRKWIATNVKYPVEAINKNIQGKVLVEFVVNPYGNVVQANVVEPVNPYLDDEAIRVVLASPKWKPGMQRGQAINVKFTFPINFVLDEERAIEPIVINNYYVNNVPSMRHSLYFGYNYHRPYYSGYYNGYYDSWYFNQYAYYGMYYPYYGNYNYGHNHYNYWYGHHYSSYNRGRHYASSGSLGWRNNYYRRNYNTNRSGYIPAPTARKSTIRNPKVSSINRTTKMTRSTRTTSAQRSTTVRKPTTTRTQGKTYRPTYSRASRSSTQTRPQYNKSSSPSRSSSSYKRPSSTNKRSYSSPSRSSSSYQRSTPTRSSGSYSRSSSPSRSSGSSSRSSGSSSRSSGSSSRSSSSRR
jgi:TonB family protein